MPSFEPHLIADYSAGEWAGKEPWLAPEAAWKTLTNCYVKNGQLRKRGGYELLDDLPAARPVMGLIENRMLDGSTELIAMSDKRLYRLESGVFVDRAGADIWTGGDSDFFVGATAADDALYLVNGVNLPKRWFGSTATLATALLTGLTNTVNYAKWTLWWKGRLWYFSTNEGGGSNRYPQRGRFSVVNTPQTFRDQDFIEATTSERMTGVRLLGERVIISFEDSHWTIVETGDFRLPFVFRQIPSTYGAVGTQASLVANDVLVSLSRFGLIGTNGDRVEKIDPELPKLMNRVLASKFAYIYGARDPANQHGWLTFVKAGDLSNKPNDVLIYDWDNGSFAFYELPMHTVGSYRAASAVLWSSLTLPWDSYSTAWDDFASGADVPILLGGDRVGNVWKLESGVMDGVTGASAGVTFKMTARTQSLNPYKGVRARLGYIDIYCSTGPATPDLLVKVYRDDETVPSVTKTIAREPTLTNSKVMRRMVVNKSAGFFTIELEHSAGNPITVDAIRLWMAPVTNGRTF